VSVALPDCFQLLFTNGDLLTEERYDALLSAGINHVVVTRHDGSSFPQRASQTVLLPQDLILTNRGGLLTSVAHLKAALSRPCYAPTDMLVVTVTGDVLLCCDDSRRAHTMGNILNEPLDEIWFSPELERIRGLLQEGRRAEASSMCAECSNTEYFGPGENYQKQLG
jgi:2-deoxy-scyllo-inosamine dehydrogenase (SAM-dependent)